MPYLTVEDLKAMHAALARGEANDRQLSLRLPERLAELAASTGKGDYAEVLRDWMWAGAIAAAAEQAAGLRGNFWVHELEDGPPRSVGLSLYDRGWVLRDPKIRAIRAYVDIRFDPAALVGPNLGHDLAQAALRVQKECLLKKSPFARVMLFWGRSPIFVEASACASTSLEELDALLDVVGTSAPEMLDTLWSKGRTFKSQIEMRVAAAVGETMGRAVAEAGLSEEEVKRGLEKGRGRGSSAHLGRGR